MRKIVSFLVVFALAFAIGFSLLPDSTISSAAMPPVVGCSFLTETRGGETWQVLQSDCDTQNFITNINTDLNQYAINMVVPVPGWRVMGPVITLGPNVKLVNGNINGVDLLAQNFCVASGDNRLSGIKIRNAENVLVKDVTVSNINLGVNERCGEGFAIWIDGITAVRGQVTLKNVKVSNYQRAGILATGSQDIYLDNSDIGKCSNEDVQSCTTVQISGQARLFGQNSHLAQNSNKSGYQSAISVALIFASSSFRSEITNLQFREGNAERAIYVFANTFSPKYDNIKISESGPDGPFSTDIGIEDRGFGAEVHNMNLEAKIRGYDTPAFFLVPVVITNGSARISAEQAETNIPRLIPE